MAPPFLLLVDDEPDFRELMRRLLERKGFTIAVAASGPEALALFEAGLKCDLILLDQRMPELTGTQTLDRLKARGITTPAVLVSAVADIQSLANAHGFDGALHKPVSLEAVVETIRRVLSAQTDLNAIFP